MTLLNKLVMPAIAMNLKIAITVLQELNVVLCTSEILSSSLIISYKNISYFFLGSCIRRGNSREKETSRTLSNRNERSQSPKFEHSTTRRTETAV